MSDNTAVHRDAFWMMVKDRIGGGMSRQVYTSDVHPNSVIKVEDDACWFQNVIEWETWNRVRGTAFERWFAPCEWISPNGIILIMAKTTPAAKLPAKLPAFFSDFKTSNYGMYKGRFVCHDYGTHLLMENGMSKRLKNTGW